MSPSEYIALRKKQIEAYNALEDFHKQINAKIYEATKQLNDQISQIARQIIESSEDSEEYKELLKKRKEAYSNKSFFQCKHVFDDGTTALVEEAITYGKDNADIKCCVCDKTWIAE